MNHLRMILGLALIPLRAWLGSWVPIATGSGTIIGLVIGIALSYLFLTYGPGRKKGIVSLAKGRAGEQEREKRKLKSLHVV